MVNKDKSSNEDDVEDGDKSDDIIVLGKDYKELYREAKGDMPRIYVDMDGVLCDFVLAAKRIFLTQVSGQNIST